MGATRNNQVGNWDLSQLQVVAEARSRRLDAVIRDPVWLMKMDVEGHEGSVLEGASDLFDIHGVEHVIVEFFPLLLRLQGTGPEAFVAFFERRGYIFFILDEPVGRLWDPRT